jgi:glycosyltransferase involved in cell wall biosynthesis
VTPRVELIHTVYPHLGQHSLTAPFVRELIKQDCHVAATAVNDGDADFPIQNVAVRKILRMLLQARMPWYQLSDVVAEVRVGRRYLRGECDVVHFFDGEHSARYLPRVLKKARTVATFHQPPDLLGNLLDRRTVARLNRVVVVSPTQRAFFEDLVPAERVRTILVGVDTEFFRPRHAPLPRGPFRCITVGHWLRDWTALRALATLLVERHPDVELHVVTNRETGLEGLPNVRRHEHLSDDDLLLLYQDSHALLLPLTASTANNALLEGLACGLPIVTTRLPAVEAYAPDPTALLVDDNDPHLLLAALETIRDDEQRSATMARLARARAEELSWSRIAACYAALYLELSEVRM